MSLVKWVEKNTRLYPAVAYRDEYTPVIPLADLTEVVEGLIKQEKDGLNKAQYIMALLDLRALFEEEKT